MPAYPKDVQLAFDTLNQVAREFRSNPYMFSTERDIQAEIYSRIRQVFRALGRDTVTGDQPGWGKDQTWSRVSCEHAMHLWSNETTQVVRPDLIVWDDVPRHDLPQQSAAWKNWPAQWACELNYIGLTTELAHPSDWLTHQLERGGLLADDIGKLSGLLDAPSVTGGKALRFGCAIIFAWEWVDSIKAAPKKEPVLWKDVAGEHRNTLWAGLVRTKVLRTDHTD